MSKTTDIRAVVEDELIFDPLVDASDITVNNVNGDVTLTGTVPSYPQFLEATDAARRVAGVTAGDNDLQVVLAPGDYRDGGDDDRSCLLIPRLSVAATALGRTREIPA